MKVTLQATPGRIVTPLSLTIPATDPIVTRLLTLLSVYNEDERGKLMLIHLEDQDFEDVKKFTEGTTARGYQMTMIGEMHGLAGWVNREFMSSIPVSEKFKNQFPDPQPTLEVVTEVTYENGDIVDATEPMFRILTAYNYNPKSLYSGPEPFQVIDGKYLTIAE